MWLNVSIFSTEELAGSLNSDFLYLVNTLTSAVVTLSGIPLSIFVCKNASHSSHNSRGNDIFACDELEISLLASELLAHSLAYSRIIALNEAD